MTTEHHKNAAVDICDRNTAATNETMADINEFEPGLDTTLCRAPVPSTSPRSSLLHQPLLGSDISNINVEIIPELNAKCEGACSDFTVVRRKQRTSKCDHLGEFNSFEERDVVVDDDAHSHQAEDIAAENDTLQAQSIPANNDLEKNIGSNIDSLVAQDIVANNDSFQEQDVVANIDSSQEQDIVSYMDLPQAHNIVAGTDSQEAQDIVTMNDSQEAHGGATVAENGLAQACMDMDSLCLKDCALLLDPETELVPLADQPAPEGLSSEHTSDVQASAHNPDGTSDSDPDNYLIQLDELIVDCENVLGQVQQLEGNADLHILRRTNNVMTYVIDKIKSFAPFPCAEDSSEDGSCTSMNAEGACAACSFPRESCTSDSDVPEDAAHINKLPREIFHQIFSYFSQSELCKMLMPVCRKWSEIASDPIHWQELNLRECPNITEYQLRSLCERSPLLKKLSLSSVTEYEAEYIAMHCEQLKHLDIGFCKGVDDFTLLAFASNCDELRDLNVEGIDFLDGRAVAEALGEFHGLHSLNLSHCIALDDDNIILISENLPSLTSINIDGIGRITDRAIVSLARSHTERLTSVILDGDNLTDLSMEALSHCTHIHTLSISFCDDFTDLSLTYVKRMSSLHVLRLRKGIQFSSALLHSLFDTDKLAKLSHLDLSECEQLLDDDLDALAKRCRVLVELDLSWCWELTDDGIKSLLQHCNLLRNLNLTGLKFMKGDVLARIPQLLPHLNTLDLQQCNLIEEDDLKKWVVTFPQLSITDYYGNKIDADFDLDS